MSDLTNKLIVAIKAIIKELPSHFFLTAVVALYCVWMTLLLAGMPFNLFFYVLFLVLSTWVLIAVKRMMVFLGFNRARVWFNYVILFWILRWVSAGIFHTAMSILYAVFLFIFSVVLIKSLLKLKSTKSEKIPKDLANPMLFWALFLLIMSVICPVFVAGIDMLLGFMDFLNFFLISMLLLTFWRINFKALQ